MVGVCHNINQQKVFMKLKLQKEMEKFSWKQFKELRKIFILDIFGYLLECDLEPFPIYNI